jgi:hypothetical protein
MPPKFITYTLDQSDNIEQLLKDTYGFSLKDFKEFAKWRRINEEIITNYTILHTKVGDLHHVIHLLFKYYNNLQTNTHSKENKLKKILNIILHASVKIQSRSHQIIPEKELLRLY